MILRLGLFLNAYGLETYGLKNKINSETINEQIYETDNLQTSLCLCSKMGESFKFCSSF